MFTTLLIEAKNVKLYFGPRKILGIPRLEILEGARIGLVGQNGAGKSTLIKVLSGELAPDEGVITRRAPISVIGQMDEGAGEGMDARARARFRAKENRAGLSGGERTRRKIALALTEAGGVLLADEPTTDLDEEGTKLLREELYAYKGALLLVSHDRALLDELCTEIWELEEGELSFYTGNYSDYRREKERRRAYSRFEYEQYKEEAARLKRSMQGVYERAESVREAPTRMGNSEARLHKRQSTDIQSKLSRSRKAMETRLNQMEVKKAPKEDPSIAMMLGACSPIRAKNALTAENLTVCAGGRELIRDASFSLPSGSRTALTGENGCGKTTLLKRLMTGEAPVRVNPAARIGYFGQETKDTLNLSKSVLENVMQEAVVPQSVARTVLARLMLRENDISKLVGVLSGGERVKTALARLLVSESNFLILDEPTNHLDVFAIEALSSVLRQYAGTLLLVSHDRRFIQDTCQRELHIAGGYLEMADEQTPPAPANESLDETAIDLKLAALASRLSSPRKGDNPDDLNAQYLALADEKRALLAARDNSAPKARR